MAGEPGPRCSAHGSTGISLNLDRSSADLWFKSIEANRYFHDLIWADRTKMGGNDLMGAKGHEAF
jgi:hypothetical protein